MKREEDAERMIKKMIKEMFNLSDEDADKIHMFKMDDGNMFKIDQTPNLTEHSVEIDPLIELIEKDDHYEILMETSGYAEEQLLINVKKEGDKVNLIFGIQDMNGRTALRRMELPDDATEEFKRYARGSVVELLVQKAK